MLNVIKNSAIMLRVMMLIIVMLSAILCVFFMLCVINNEYRPYSGYAEYHYAECRYAECLYAECRYAKCRSAAQNSYVYILLLLLLSELKHSSRLSTEKRLILTLLTIQQKLKLLNIPAKDILFYNVET